MNWYKIAVIRSKLSIKDALDILELPVGATKEQITKQRNKLAIKYHPDRFGPEGNDKMVMVNLAFEKMREINFDTTKQEFSGWGRPGPGYGGGYDRSQYRREEPKKDRGNAREDARRERERQEQTRKEWEAHNARKEWERREQEERDRKKREQDKKDQEKREKERKEQERRANIPPWQTDERSMNNSVGNDFRDINFSKKSIYENSIKNGPVEKYSIDSFDGSFFRGSLSVYTNEKSLGFAGEVMEIWSGEGNNSFIIATKPGLNKAQIIRKYGKDVSGSNTSYEFDSFNDYPGNDQSFVDFLRKEFSKNKSYSSPPDLDDE